MLLWIAIALLLIVCFLLDLVFKPSVNLPCPKRLPIIGQLFAIGSKPHIAFSEWTKEHGNIFTIHIFQQSFLVLNDYESIYEALVTKGKVFGGRPFSFRCDYIVKGQDVATQDYCPALKLIKNKWHSLLKQYGDGMDRIESVVLDIASELTSTLSGDSKEVILDPYEAVYSAVCETLVITIIGKKYHKNNPIMSKCFIIDKIAMEYFSALGKGVELEVFPWLRHFGIASFQQVKKIKQIFNEVFDFLKHEFESNDSVDHEGVVFSLLKDLENYKNDPDFTEDRVKYSMFDMIVAGIATSARSLYLAIMLLGANQHIQDKIYKEVQAVLAMKSDGTKLTKVTLKDRESMPYIRAFLLELQRYGALVPFSFPHKIMQATTIQNVKVPAGMYVLFNLWHLHHSSEYWENPWVFNPQRFLDNDGQLLPCDHERRRRMMPFGAGTRVCLGQNLAMARLFFFVTSIVDELQVFPIPGMELNHDPRTFKFNEVLSPNRYTVKFVRRKC